ncbi:hypothetical protein A2U01_0057043, partial [Trifolium medium]|nr:hypothetical protein [Trifolium medium]
MKNPFKKSKQGKGDDVGSSSRTATMRSKKKRGARLPTPTPSLSPSPPPPPAQERLPLDIPRDRFVWEEAVDRYHLIRYKTFNKERALSVDVLNLPLIKAEFARRKWESFNNSITSGNRTMAMEF